MNKIKILTKNEKSVIESKLDESFGIKYIPGLILMMGKEKLFLYMGNPDIRKIRVLERLVPIERMGIYFAKLVNNEIKLSIEGTQILHDQITKNIFQLDSKQAEEWMMGRELPIKTGKKAFLILKNREDFLGTGKASEEKIGNYIPKNRRLKNRES